MKKFLAPTLGALLAAGALSIAPAQAIGGDKTTLTILFGNDGTSETVTRVVVSDGATNSTYDKYEPGAIQDGEEVSLPADAELFSRTQSIRFNVPTRLSTGGADVVVPQHVLFRFGSSWTGGDEYDDGFAPQRTLSDTSDTAVYVTRCSEFWDFNEDPPSCGTTPYETILVAGEAPNPGNDGASSGSGSGLSAPMLDLTLDPTETDATCSVARVSGPRGSWVTLEAASDCTPPPSTPDATLLGWATDPDFPVDIAQRQVDNGWGTYETYNDDGQLTSVFIPAGGAAQLTNSNTLYAIWSDTSAGS